MFDTINATSFQELSVPEMLLINGGALSWKKFGKTTAVGAVGGAATYLVTGWW